MVSRPKREPDVIQGAVEGSLELLGCFDCRISEPQWWKNKGLLGSQSTGRRVTRLAGKPKQPRWAKSRKEGSDARASRRCPRAPTLLPRRLARRASASKIPAPSQARPPRPLSLPLGSVRERNFLLRGH